MFKISTVPLNFPKLRVSTRNFAFLDENFPESLKLGKAIVPCPPTLPRRTDADVGNDMATVNNSSVVGYKDIGGGQNVAIF